MWHRVANPSHGPAPGMLQPISVRSTQRKGRAVVRRQRRREEPPSDLGAPGLGDVRQEAVTSVVAKLERVGRAITANRRLQLADLGLDTTGYHLLATLAQAGTPRPAGHLALELGLTGGALTQRVDRLEAEGLVQRTRHPPDRRGVLLSLTASGRRSADRAVEVVAQADAAFGAVLDEEAAHALLRLLSAFADPRDRASTSWPSPATSERSEP